MRNPAALQAAAAQLQEPLPQRIGNWQMFGPEQQLGDDEQRMLQCRAYVYRIYEHVQTGDVISVALLLGPTGPIAVHTPEICYSSRDYSISDDRRETAIEDADHVAHTFWEIRATPNQAGPLPLRVLYGWTTGAAWEATRRPRFAFGGSPYLYKLQLTGPVTADSPPSEFDPCQDFLAQFLAQAGPRLIDARPSAR